MPERSPGTAIDPDRRAVVLVVDDDILVRSAITEHLRFFGYLVVEAADGTEAIGILRSSSPVELVFSDVSMPGSISGFDLARWLHENRPGIPIILTSGNLDSAGAGLLAQGIPFLPKPYRFDAVADRIRALLAKPG